MLHGKRIFRCGDRQSSVRSAMSIENASPWIVLFVFQPRRLSGLKNKKKLWGYRAPFYKYAAPTELGGPMAHAAIDMALLTELFASPPLLISIRSSEDGRTPAPLSPRSLNGYLLDPTGFPAF